MYMFCMVMKISFARAEILSTLKDNPMTITQLSKRLGKGYSRTTIYHYIKELKERGLIYEKLATKKKGDRVPKLLLTDKANPLSQKFFDVYNLFKKTFVIF